MSTAPAQVTVFNSVCTTGCVVQGGFFIPPTCPTGSYVEYSVNNGGWTSNMPTYGPALSIRTRCTCETNSEIFGPASEPAAVTMPGVCTPPAPSITSPNTALCVGGTRTLVGSPAGGVFSVSDGPGTIGAMNLLTATGAGTIMISYTVTDANGCQGTDMQSITVNPFPTGSCR